MGDRPQPNPQDELHAYLAERARRRAGQDHPVQWAAGGGGHAGAHPLAFDESGFPIPQPRQRLLDRVRQLIGT